jgi:hypothetical protein
MAQTYTFPVPEGKTAQELLAKAKELGRGKGIALVGDDKSGSFKGTAEGTYSVAGGTITIEVAKKPGFVPWMMIESALKDVFGQKK